MKNVHKKHSLDACTKTSSTSKNNEILYSNSVEETGENSPKSGTSGTCKKNDVYGNKRNRFNSMSITAPKLFIEESEDILKLLSSKQNQVLKYKTSPKLSKTAVKLNKLSTNDSNEAMKEADENEEEDEIEENKGEKGIKTPSTNINLCFSNRARIIEWALSVLKSIVLTDLEKSSIFHRVCIAYDLIMKKLTDSNMDSIINDEKELKIFSITIFLLAYKLEGYSIAKVTISSLVEAFLSDMNISAKALRNKIYIYEVKIIKLIDFNPQIFDDNNLHQLTFILFDLFNKKYNNKFDSSDVKNIEKVFLGIIEEMEFNNKIQFNKVCLDKGIIGLYSAVLYYSENYLDKNWYLKVVKNFNEYFKFLSECKIITISEEELRKHGNKYKKMICEN